jgi:serine O-acetyltransferase
VIGETAVVDDDVSILHAVTLGGTGKQTGDRHPKIRQGVLLSVGATVLGNIEIGKQSRVGAGSVVLTQVPPDCSAVGVPARVIPRSDSLPPSQSMDHVGEIPGP